MVREVRTRVMTRPEVASSVRLGARLWFVEEVCTRSGVAALDMLASSKDDDGDDVDVGQQRRMFAQLWACLVVIVSGNCYGEIRRGTT